MKRSKMMELGVGLFMLAGIVGLIFLGLRVSGLNLPGTGGGETFQLKANFANVGSLKPRARVTLAGVNVGRVVAIELDTEWYDAQVTLELDAELEGQLPRDTTASILTSGLLGEQYIGLSVGGDPDTLGDGDTIRDTQSALVLEELIQQFVSNMVSE
ncbi:outer membrane lipid asymmetry maintenance protein MlaD [Litchfieldella qijiaojingensis]|uniref:Outer membrane lipid asymmetry maintenance protein MlaD n=1 Tax=Litchfieldella qijiaojingensis TaxID=980347 RepID=A0ABQ2YEL1_9GAMM|nr:outer membrane lipid asymmetry maintenance protein MlaD [Halomonas qijiaojingensis]GGX81833.1 outer membrane lipid asymmetry maintenance protein MlaD [Halomonas qijiaojingensis]